METKEVNIKNMPISLDKIQESYEYIDPVLHRNFTEFKEPVIDSDGHIREKNEYQANKSLYRKDVVTHERNSVTLIDSPDIRNIQADHRRLEKNYNNVMDMLSILMMKMDKQNTIMEEQSRIMEEQSLKIDRLIKENKEQKETISGLKEDMALISKRAEYEFNVLTDKLDIQTGISRNQEAMLNSQAVKIESLEKFIGTLDEIDTFKQFYRNKMKLHPEQRQRLAFDDKNEMDAEFENIPLINQEWLGIKFSASIGFRDTFSIFTPSSVLKTQKLENELRKMAADGDLKRMQSFIERNNSIVNGRGMPDSICSRTNHFFDKTALMLAAKNGHLDCVKFLIANGAEINFLDRDNFTALDYAQQNFHKPVSDYLKKHYGVNGIDVLSVVKEKEIDDIVGTFEVVGKGKSSIPSTRSCAF